MDALLEEKEKEILDSGDLNLIELLLSSKGDHDAWLELEKKRAHLESMNWVDNEAEED